MGYDFCYCGSCDRCYPCEEFEHCRVCEDLFKAECCGYICDECFNEDYQIVLLEGKEYRVIAHKDCIETFNKLSLEDKKQLIKRCNEESDENEESEENEESSNEGKCGYCNESKPYEEFNNCDICDKKFNHYECGYICEDCLDIADWTHWLEFEEHNYCVLSHEMCVEDFYEKTKEEQREIINNRSKFEIDLEKFI